MQLIQRGAEHLLDSDDFALIIIKRPSKERVTQIPGKSGKIFYMRMSILTASLVNALSATPATEKLPISVALVQGLATATGAELTLARLGHSQGP